MFKFIALFLYSFLCFAQEGINDLSEVIVTPQIIAFKSKAANGAWTIQTLTRNYDVFGLTVSQRPDYVEEIEGGIPVKHFNTDSIPVIFSAWATEIEHDTMLFVDLIQFNANLSHGYRNKLAMIGYLNRKKLPFLETFFQRTYTVGSREFKTTLEKPIDVIDYRENTYFVYKDNFNIYMILPQRSYSFAKSDYEWTYENSELVLYPTSNFVKTKPISAISSGRDWYNLKWEKLRKDGKLFATVSMSGLIWNTRNLSADEKNLVEWFKKN
jgi:hypothetical protein